MTNSLYALLVAWQKLLAWDLSEEDMLKLHNEGFIYSNFDLKSSIPSDENHIPQLVSGDCFADYLLAVLERFEQHSRHGWQCRYFIFHCGNNRRTTLPGYAQNPPNNVRADKAHILTCLQWRTGSLTQTATTTFMSKNRYPCLRTPVTYVSGLYTGRGLGRGAIQL